VAAPPAAPPAPSGPAPAPDAPATYTPRHLAEKILTSRSALEGERKQVSVLFADCAGFTALSARLDPEDLHAVMDGCFARVLDAVHRYEGTVNQFTGDGVMALFGAPIAHEDHAVRAVAAALAVQKAIQEYGATLRETHGVEFTLRIGVNTGPVVVGKIGDDLRMDYTAQGETVNLAARLQSAARPGEVLISEATERLVSGYFVTEDRGRLELKGLPEPVHALAVADQRRRRARFDVAVERGLTPLVGRSAELTFLRECLARAQAGRGQIISVVGEAGVGKSRVVWELRRTIDPAACTYLEGRCQPHGETLPFHLVTQLLQANFGLEDGESEATHVEKVIEGTRRLDPGLEWAIPYLKHVLALPAPELARDGLDHTQRKQRLVEAVKAFTLRGAQHRPIVLVADDLQWTDPGSLEVLESLVDSVSGHRILVVCAFRSGWVPSWGSRAQHQRLSLDRLSEADTTRMVVALLGDDPRSVRAGELVAARAEGNPFFIEELIRYVRERPDGDSRLPDTVQDLLTARIDRLSEPLKRTLQLASVLGRDFALGVLERLAPAGTDVKGNVADLLRLELLREKELFPELRYSFSHLLIQQAAYESLLLKARAELHGQAAAALEEGHAGRTDEILVELAEHYGRSADAAKAVDYLVRAGDRAAGLFAYAQASHDYRRALERVPATPDAAAQRALVLEKLGDAAHAQGSLGEARARWLGALALVSPGERPRQVAELHRKLGAACWDAGEPAEALAHLERGLAALKDDAVSPEGARLAQELARVHVRRGEHARATEWARRALELGERLGASDVVSLAYNTWGVALARSGEVEEGATFVQKSLETALAHELGAAACRAYTNLAVMYAGIDSRRSRAYCEDGLALARKIGDQLQQSWLQCALAGGHCMLAGDYDAGVRAAEAAVELDRRLGQRNHLPIPLIILAQVHQCRGDYERSDRVYREALTVAEAVGEPQLLVPCYEGLATLAIERGDEAEAETWLDRSRLIQQATGWDSDSFLVLPFLT
jgi:adenylate cyclase